MKDFIEYNNQYKEMKREKSNNDRQKENQYLQRNLQELSKDNTVK